MTPAAVVALVALVVIIVLMNIEAYISRSHEATLRARGAIEPADDVLPIMTWAYPACFTAMLVEGAMFGPPPGVHTVVGAAVFIAAKLLKFWAIASLGERWTFHVLVLPDAPLVSRGPYAFIRHPNYVAVVGELIGTAIVVGAPVTGVLSIVGFGLLLRRRIAVEERALGFEAEGHKRTSE